MSKNHRLPFRQNYIRLSGQILHMQTKLETGGVQLLPDRDFRLCTLTTTPTHIPGSLCCIEMIRCAEKTLLTQRRNENLKTDPIRYAPARFGNVS